MSEQPVRVALVAEGPTDRIIIECALSSMLAGRSFILIQLHPEESLAFGPTGTGWVGVYNWCRQAVARASGLGNDFLYHNYDILILHLDADVAGHRYDQGSIEEEVQDIPCVQDCPPASATTNVLRPVLLRWAGETSLPPRTVICMPSKSTEAWVVAALFPEDSAVQRGIECHANPVGRLGQQPANRRIQKRQGDYRNHAQAMTDAWPRLSGSLTEAQRFQTEFMALVPPARA